MDSFDKYRSAARINDLKIKPLKNMKDDMNSAEDRLDKIVKDIEALQKKNREAEHQLNKTYSQIANSKQHAQVPPLPSNPSASFNIVISRKNSRLAKTAQQSIRQQITGQEKTEKTRKNEPVTEPVIQDQDFHF